MVIGSEHLNTIFKALKESEYPEIQLLGIELDNIITETGSIQTIVYSCFISERIVPPEVIEVLVHIEGMFEILSKAIEKVNAANKA